MDKTWICSCGYYEWHENTGDDLEDFGPSAWYHNWPCDGGDYNNNIFCFKCGDQLLPDGRVIQRESVPNRLMDMLKEVQANCTESGLQEFALKVFNWIENERHANNKPFFQVASQANYYCAEYSNDFLCEPSRITLGELFRLLNAAKQEDGCGEKLNPSGTVEPHTNIVKLFSAMRIIQDYKIEIYCDDDGVFQIQEQQINGRRIGLGHPMGEDLAALVLKHYPDILDAEDEMEATK